MAVLGSQQPYSIASAEEPEPVRMSNAPPKTRCHTVGALAYLYVRECVALMAHNRSPKRYGVV